jgi:hypothetical protein
MRKASLLLAACVGTVVLGGCIPSISPRQLVTDVAWVSHDKIYLLRDSGSGVRELWLREAGRERKVASNVDMPDLCGMLDFLFTVKPGVLGLAIECDGFERLLSYSEVSGAFVTIGDVSPAAEVALEEDGRSGYISTGKDGCWAIHRFGGDAGNRSIDWDGYSCRSGKSAKSPSILGDGRIAFLATSELPPDRPEGDERRVWRLMIISKDGKIEPLGPKLNGFPELTLIPGSNKGVIMLSSDDLESVFEVDFSNGELRRIYHEDGFVSSPGVSPDGKRVAFGDGKGRVVIRNLS